MRILQVCPYYFLSWSRDKPVELLTELSRTLIENGHRLEIYTTDVFNCDGPGNKIKMHDGIVVHEYRSIGKYPLFVSPALAAGLWKAMGKFDVVHVHEYRNYTNLLVYLFSIMRGVPYVIQAHGALSTEIGRSGMKKAFDRVLGRRILARASRVIAITETEAELYTKLGVPREKIALVPNGIDLRDFADLPPAGTYKKRYGFLPQSKLIVYVGRIDRTKGIDLLIRAFAGIVRNAADARLIIAGKDYGCLSDLTELARECGVGDRVIFTGFLDREDKLAALVDAVVFVTPAYYGFPHTFLESCACGTPVVTTTRGDGLDWINDNVGLVVDYGDEGKLCDGICRILSDARTRARFSENGKRVVAGRFAWPEIARDLEAVYRSALEKAPGDAAR